MAEFCTFGSIGPKKNRASWYEIFRIWMPSNVKLDLPLKKFVVVVVQMFFNLKFCFELYEVLDFPIHRLLVDEQDQEFR
jgi:hypothetical protein